VRQSPRRSPSRASLAPHARSIFARDTLKLLSVLERNVINKLHTCKRLSIQFRVVNRVVNVINMKKAGSHCSLGNDDRPTRIMDSILSDEVPETERLLSAQLAPVVAAMSSGRRQSLTAPPSPTDSRKKRHHHNYRNHLHHLIHWRDIWGGEPHKVHEVVQKYATTVIDWHELKAMFFPVIVHCICRYIMTKELTIV
jgi:hypothetical protein